MKVIFLLNLDLEHKAGLYNAIHNRMKIQKEQFDSIFYNIVIIDSKFLALLKKVFKKKKIYKYDGNDMITIDGVNYINLYYKNSIFGKIFDYFKMDYFKYRSIIKIIKKDIKNIEMIVAHFGYPQGRIAYYINKLFKVNYTVYYHGSDIHTFATKNSRNKTIIFEVMKNAKINIFVSKALMTQVVKLGYKYNNIVDSCNGIDIDIFKYKKNMKQENYKKSIGFIGNLEPMKRAEFLPEIFKRVKEGYQNVEFVVIGDGSLRQYIEKKFNEYNLPVNFTGRINHLEVARHLNTFDILILPSRKEAWGCVLIEANACGVYNIGTDVGGIPEAIGEFGEIVENEDTTIVKNISELVIKNLNKHIEKSKLIDRTSKYSWNYICEKENKYIILK